MIYIYFGDVGAGKTYMLAWHAYNVAKKQKRTEVWGNFDFKPPENVNYHKWDSPEDDNFKKAHCGLLLIDEAGLIFNSRKAKELSEEAKKKIVQHRKMDSHMVCATQSVKYLDLMFREQGAVAFHMRQVKLPFLGFLFPRSVVKVRYCPQCKKVPLDVNPDDIGWRKWFAFGTLFLRRSYHVGDLMEEGALQAVQTDQKNKIIIPFGWKIILYDNLVASSFDTTEIIHKH